jgi:hypothetical protein
MSEEVCPKIYIGKDPDPEPDQDPDPGPDQDPDISKVGSGSGQKSSGSATLNYDRKSARTVRRQGFDSASYVRLPSCLVIVIHAATRCVD